MVFQERFLRPPIPGEDRILAEMHDELLQPHTKIDPGRSRILPGPQNRNGHWPIAQRAPQNRLTALVDDRDQAWPGSCVRIDQFGEARIATSKGPISSFFAIRLERSPVAIMT